MKPAHIVLACLLFILSSARGDLTLATYEIVPRFSVFSSYNPFSDLSFIHSAARHIAQTCKAAGDRRSCVSNQLATLNAAEPSLTWALDICPSNAAINIDDHTSLIADPAETLAGILNECSASSSTSLCECGAVHLPLGGGARMEFSPRDGSVLMRFFVSDTEYTSLQRTIGIPALFEFDNKTQAVKQLDGLRLVIGRVQCQEAGYCDDEGFARVVKTPQGVAIAKNGGPGMPACRGLSSANHFLLCVETRQEFKQVQAVNPTSHRAPLQYRFAITVGSERRALKPGIGDPAVIAELERQVGKSEYAFASESERETFRELVFASTHAESGFNHYDPFDGSVLEGHDPGGSIGYGAMQITDPFHPSCFNKGGAGICADSPECAGTSALDLTCNVAAGVRLHYGNLQLAKSRLSDPYYTSMCGGGMSATDLMLKFYNAGAYAADGPGCSYVTSVKNRVDQIFEEAPSLVPVASTPPVSPLPAPGGSLYLLGDSLVVGYENAGLRDALSGFSSVTINGEVGRSLSGGLSALQGDSAAIAGASNVVIALGTNPSGIAEQFSQQVSSAIDAVRAANPSASITWVKVYYTNAPEKSASLKSTYAGYNAALESLSASKGFSLISLQDILGQQTVESCIASDPELIHPSACYGQFATALAGAIASPSACEDPGGVLTYVDRSVSLGESFAPADLVPFGSHSVRSLIAGELQSLIDAAAADGVSLWIDSGYRSYATQASLFENYVQQEMAKGLSREEAEAEANTYSAYPGHSEHQLGTTVDLNFIDVQDLSDARVSWTLANAHRFGFVVSYPPGKQHLTGYISEPWHIRYVGRTIAADLYERGYLSSSNDWTLNKYLSDVC